MRVVEEIASKHPKVLTLPRVLDQGTEPFDGNQRQR